MSCVTPRSARRRCAARCRARGARTTKQACSCSTARACTSSAIAARSPMRTCGAASKVSATALLPRSSRTAARRAPYRCRCSSILRRRRGRRRASASRRFRTARRPARPTCSSRATTSTRAGSGRPRTRGGVPPRPRVLRVEREGGGRRVPRASTDTTRIDLAALSAKWAADAAGSSSSDRLLDAGITEYLEPAASSWRASPQNRTLPAVAPYVDARAGEGLPVPRQRRGRWLGVRRPSSRCSRATRSS